MPQPLTIEDITTSRRVIELAIMDTAKRLFYSEVTLPTSESNVWDVMLDDESVGDIHQNSTWNGETFVLIQKFQATAREHGEVAMFDDKYEAAIWVVAHHIRSRPL